MEISKETFEQMDSDSRLNVLFDLISYSCHKLEELNGKLDRKKKIDMTVAGAMGFFGGVIAHLGQLTILGHK